MSSPVTPWCNPGGACRSHRALCGVGLTAGRVVSAYHAQACRAELYSGAQLCVAGSLTLAVHCRFFASSLSATRVQAIIYVLADTQDKGRAAYQRSVQTSASGR